MNDWFVSLGGSLVVCWTVGTRRFALKSKGIFYFRWELGPRGMVVSNGLRAVYCSPITYKVVCC